MVASGVGEFLVKQGKLEPEKLERAIRLQAESERPLNTVLVQLGFVAERDIAESYAGIFNLPLAETIDYPETPLLGDKVSPEFLKSACIVPLAEYNDHIVVAIADPCDQYSIQALGFFTGKNISLQVGLKSEIGSVLQRLYPDETHPLGQITEGVAGAIDIDSSHLDDIQHLRDLASEAPIIRLVNMMISQALQVQASDIHIEPFEAELKVRYRIDGVLHEMEAPAARYSAAIISRIKVMASLDIAERRLPQDGRIRLRIDGHDIDMRISTVPTMYGESVVMRILDKGSLQLEFPVLGFSKDIQGKFEEILLRPQGIILVTGPTGSGKTTTLYAALHRLNTSEKKIITIEDPVEYQLTGINQIQVKPLIGLGFANTLRSILRHDPDIIMVGEMRDTETAKIAVQAALTGHKVFSTLHTNNAASSITRLFDMGIEDYLLASSLSGVLAQRLVRILCRHCRRPLDKSSQLIKKLRLEQLVPGDEISLYQAAGCDHCDNTGYLGRTGIHELLVITDVVREAILKQGDAGAIHKSAVDNGMISMYQDGMRKAVAGMTTVDEIIRAVQED